MKSVCDSRPTVLSLNRRSKSTKKVSNEGQLERLWGYISQKTLSEVLWEISIQSDFHQMF